jgi:AcrR family transcriptional regulator
MRWYCVGAHVGQRYDTKRQAQAAATQQQLLRAAHDVFAERGFAGTSVGAITKAANTAHGTFYLYYRNKEDIFAKVVEEVMLDVYERALSAPLEGQDLRRVLESAIAGFLEVFVQNAGVWRALIEGACTTPAVEHSWAEIRAGFNRRVADRFRQMQDLGIIRDCKPELMAVVIGGMIEWTATTQFVLRPPQLEASMDELVSTLADVWERTLVPPVVSIDLT